jgi:hypothetical protein
MTDNAYNITQPMLMSPTIVEKQYYSYGLHDSNNLAFRNNQSASPKNHNRINPGMLIQNFSQFDQSSFEGRNVISERFHSQDEIDQENYPCLVYLENGRYRNSF